MDASYQVIKYWKWITKPLKTYLLNMLTTWLGTNLFFCLSTCIPTCIYFPPYNLKWMSHLAKEQSLKVLYKVNQFSFWNQEPSGLSKVYKYFTLRTGTSGKDPGNPWNIWWVGLGSKLVKKKNKKKK